MLWPVPGLSPVRDKLPPAVRADVKVKHLDVTPEVGDDNNATAQATHVKAQGASEERRAIEEGKHVKGKGKLHRGISYARKPEPLREEQASETEDSRWLLSWDSLHSLHEASPSSSFAPACAGSTRENSSARDVPRHSIKSLGWSGRDVTTRPAHELWVTAERPQKRKMSLSKSKKQILESQLPAKGQSAREESPKSNPGHPGGKFGNSKSSQDGKSASNLKSASVQAPKTTKTHTHVAAAAAFFERNTASRELARRMLERIATADQGLDGLPVCAQWRPHGSTSKAGSSRVLKGR